MPLSIGQVLSLRCLLCNPPKQKLFVIALLDPLRLFLINSEPSPFQSSSPKQMAALAPILVAEHPKFLTHDSFVACTQISSEYSADQIVTAIARDPACYKGDLSTNARIAVARALADNRLIPTKYRNPLATAWPSPLDEMIVKDGFPAQP